MTFKALLIAVSLFLTGSILSGHALADQQGEPRQAVIKSGSKPSGKASNTTFTGNVRHDPMFSTSEEAPYSVSYVTFEPGARSFWHTHPAGQRLIVTFGAGLTGTVDGSVEEIKAGDIVECPAGVKHWHGASPTTAMTHIAITPMKDGKNVEWMEEVTDEQYNRR